MIIKVKNKESLIFEDFTFRCTVGKKGISSKKKEGDFCTPRGSFNLGSVYYRSDRIRNIKTKLKIIKIKKSMGWCNDSKSRKYNSLVKIRDKFKHEKLYRKDNKYDIVVVIGYNFKKPIPFNGSAIFLHLTKNYKGTAGCIALNKNDLLILLRLINKKTKIRIF